MPSGGLTPLAASGARRTWARTASRQAEGGDVKEYLYKILVVGDIGTGKTSIIKRYVHNIFSQHYKSTVRPRRGRLGAADGTGARADAGHTPTETGAGRFRLARSASTLRSRCSNGTMTPSSASSSGISPARSASET